MTADPDVPADVRRAAALVLHHARRDVEGINEILLASDEADRTTHLLIAVLDLYQYLMPSLYTPLGVQFLTDAVLRLAADTPEETS